MALLQIEATAPVASYEAPAKRWAVISLYMLLASLVAAPLMAFQERVQHSGSEGNLLRQAMFLAVFFLSVVAARLARPPFKIYALPASITITLFYCLVTETWSVDPSTGIRRLFLTTIVIVVIFINNQILSFEQTARIIRRFLVGVLFANLLVIIIAPGIGIHNAGEVASRGIDTDLIGNWKGILAHKNFAGSLCVMTILFLVIEAEEWSLSVRCFLIALSALFLWKSASKTSGGLVLVVLFLAQSYRIYNHRYRKLFVMSLALFFSSLTAAIWVYWDELIKPFNNPDAFTGRVAIWRVLYRFWNDHPWGAGYGSFWNVGGARPLAHYTKEKDWVSKAFEAHNGYMDLLIQIGTFGAVVAVFALVVLPILKLLIWRPERRSEGMLALAMLLFCALHNLMESSFLDRDAIIEVFLFISIALIEKTTRLDRLNDMRFIVRRNG